MGAGTTSDAPTTVYICAAICYWLQRIDFVLCGVRKVESKKDVVMHNAATQTNTHCTLPTSGIYRFTMSVTEVSRPPLCCVCVCGTRAVCVWKI